MEHFLQQLKELSSAEDFLVFFGIPFEQSVVNVSRLHILKRFFQYLRQQQLPGQNSEVQLFTAYRNLLARAYQDFARCFRTPKAANTCRWRASRLRCPCARLPDGGRCRLSDKAPMRDALSVRTSTSPRARRDTTLAEPPKQTSWSAENPGT